MSKINLIGSILTTGLFVWLAILAAYLVLKASIVAGLVLGFALWGFLAKFTHKEAKRQIKATFDQREVYE